VGLADLARLEDAACETGRSAAGLDCAGANVCVKRSRALDSPCDDRPRSQMPPQAIKARWGSLPDA